MKLIDREYYLNPDVVGLAKSLLGKIIVSKVDNHITSGIIIETEAYKAPEDRASHAFNNRRTPRTSTMFMEGGHAYVYICYGIHHLFNVITAVEGIPHAVLIRALEPLDGLDHMLIRRKMSALNYTITKGPGSLSQALGITQNLNATKLYDRKSPIQLFESNQKYSDSQIGISKRIGVESSGESASLPYRFYVKGNVYVSGKNT
ncbi:MAG: DNA-3-methyladenine glycosylase [Saprospiraceae bacterium]|nr:DNA-3-methyladenine glycosylase [Saprospiraceae bacterium]MBK7738939.1 DNA-3-methyladenine glycosylase [Saprospiraceae bacterium]MBK7913028.1 DNA-3-methyladenine glycosylase [Saprospiraceae bacterium]